MQPAAGRGPPDGLRCNVKSVYPRILLCQALDFRRRAALETRLAAGGIQNGNALLLPVVPRRRRAVGSRCASEIWGQILRTDRGSFRSRLIPSRLLSRVPHGAPSIANGTARGHSDRKTPWPLATDARIVTGQAAERRRSATARSVQYQGGASRIAPLWKGGKARRQRSRSASDESRRFHRPSTTSQGFHVTTRLLPGALSSFSTNTWNSRRASGRSSRRAVSQSTQLGAPEDSRAAARI